MPHIVTLLGAIVHKMGMITSCKEGVESNEVISNKEKIKTTTMEKL